MFSQLGGQIPILSQQIFHFALFQNNHMKSLIQSPWKREHNLISWNNISYFIVRDKKETCLNCDNHEFVLVAVFFPEIRQAHYLPELHVSFMMI